MLSTPTAGLQRPLVQPPQPSKNVLGLVVRSYKARVRAFNNDGAQGIIIDPFFAPLVFIAYYCAHSP